MILFSMHYVVYVGFALCFNPSYGTNMFGVEK